MEVRALSECIKENLWIWVLAAVILAAVLSQNRKNEHIEIIAAFFEILGDILGLLALQARTSCCEGSECDGSGCSSCA